VAGPVSQLELSVGQGAEQVLPRRSRGLCRASSAISITNAQSREVGADPGRHDERRSMARKSQPPKPIS
jgi:hypothetical protein